MRFELTDTEPEAEEEAEVAELVADAVLDIVSALWTKGWRGREEDEGGEGRVGEAVLCSRPVCASTARVALQGGHFL